jgi:hypothetical protein
MPLLLKTLQEVSAELGIPEVELKALVQMQKIRGMMKPAIPPKAPPPRTPPRRFPQRPTDL